MQEIGIFPTAVSTDFHPNIDNQEYLQQTIAGLLGKEAPLVPTESLFHLAVHLDPDAPSQGLALRLGEHNLSINVDAESLTDQGDMFVHLAVARVQEMNPVTGDFLIVAGTIGPQKLTADNAPDWVKLAAIVPDEQGTIAVRSFIDNPEQGTSLTMVHKDATLIFSYSYGEWSATPIGMLE